MTPNPFPLEIVEKVNSPELLAFLQQFGHDKYADADDINKILQALQFIYENLGGSAISDLTKFTARPTISIDSMAILISDDGEWLVNGVPFSQTTGASFTVNLASEGNVRLDIIVADDTGDYRRLQGSESETNPAAPTLPLNCLLVSIVSVGDSGFDIIPLSAIQDLIDPEGDNQLVIGPNGKLYINVAAGSTPDATESVKGKAQLATEAETISGVNDAKIVTPATLAAAFADRDLGYSPENVDNKTNTVSGNETSTTLYASVKGLVDWIASRGFITSVITSLGYTPENSANKGVANGYVPLNSSVKIDTTYLPDSILGQLLYGGVVDASTAIATLTNNAKSKLGTGAATITLMNNTTAITGYASNEGIYYIVTVAGTFAGVSFEVGDWLVSIGSAWRKIDNTDAIASFNGRTGTITLISSDVTSALGYTPENTSNKSTSIADSASNVKFPVWSAILSYFDASRIRTILSITTLSGSNTGDQDLSGLMVKANNGNDIVNIATFRANLGVDKLTSNGDSNYSILSTDKAVVTSATLTGSRTWTLPLANSVNAGYEIIVADLFGGISSANTLIITRSGSNTINGATSQTIGAQYGMRRFISDGSSRWTFDAGVMRISDYIGTTLTPSVLVATDSNSKLQPLSTSTYPSLTETSYLKGVTSAIQTQFGNKQDKSSTTTGEVISFTTPQVYNSVASPTTSNITNDLTGATIGVVQKIYHNHSVAPTFPGGWVRLGTGAYVTSTLNVIYCEWVSGSRVEYWIVQ